jgi:hypothetical protein
MGNLSFLPQNIEDKYISKKIKAYKGYAFTLWIICLILFLGFTYLKYRRDQLQKQDLNNRVNLADKAPKLPRFKSNTIITLNRFIDNFNGKMRYGTVVINDKLINLDVIVEDKLSYYKFIREVEHMDGISILEITPLKKDNDKFTFKLIVEAS